MKFLKALLIGVTAAIVTAALIRMANWDGARDLRLASQPVFDRVMKTHTLRCISGYPAPAYAAAEPTREVHRNLSRAIVEQMGHILNLQIEWVEDVPPEQVADHIARGEEDAMCLAFWPSGKTASVLEFTAPVDYVPVYAYARPDEARFDNDLSKIEDANVTVAVLDNMVSKNIADEDFPGAKQYSVTDVADNLHLLLAVTSQKADVTFSDPFVAEDFIKNNPGTLKRVTTPPARVFFESFAVAKGEDKLRDMLNVALDQMQQSGFIRTELDKYLGDRKGEFFYVSKSWE